MTMSFTSAMKEFPGLDYDDLREYSREHQIQVQRRACHGNPFYVVERADVLDMVEGKKDKDPTFKAGLQAKAEAAVISKAKKDLRDAAAEIKAAERKREAALETLRKHGIAEAPAKKRRTHE